MSNPVGQSAPLYVVTLTAAEVDTLELAIGRRVGAVLAPKPRAPRVSAARATSKPWRAVGPAPVAHQHLTPEAEAWLAARATPGYLPRAIATPPLGKPRKMTDQARLYEESAWARYAAMLGTDRDHVGVTAYVAEVSRQVAMLDALGARA